MDIDAFRECEREPRDRIARRRAHAHETRGAAHSEFDGRRDAGFELFRSESRRAWRWSWLSRVFARAAPPSASAPRLGLGRAQSEAHAQRCKEHRERHHDLSTRPRELRVSQILANIWLTMRPGLHGRNDQSSGAEEEVSSGELLRWPTPQPFHRPIWRVSPRGACQLLERRLPLISKRHHLTK